MPSPLLCVYTKQRVEPGTGKSGDDEDLIFVRREFGVFPEYFLPITEIRSVDTLDHLPQVFE
jgi:hypothetical protein